MTTPRARILLIPALLTLQACHKPPDAGNGDGSRTKLRLPQSTIAPLPPSQGDIRDRQRFIEEAVPYIKIQRSSNQPYQAARPIRYLFTIWEPKGKSAEELEAMIGMPTLAKDDRLEYTLLDEARGAAGGYRFVFYISEGRIVRYESGSFD